MGRKKEQPIRTVADATAARAAGRNPIVLMGSGRTYCMGDTAWMPADRVGTNTMVKLWPMFWCDGCWQHANHCNPIVVDAGRAVTHLEDLG